MVSFQWCHFIRYGIIRRSRTIENVTSSDTSDMSRDYKPNYLHDSVIIFNLLQHLVFNPRPLSASKELLRTSRGTKYVTDIIISVS